MLFMLRFWSMLGPRWCLTYGWIAGKSAPWELPGDLEDAILIFFRFWLRFGTLWGHFGSVFYLLSLIFVIFWIDSSSVWGSMFNKLLYYFWQLLHRSRFIFVLGVFPSSVIRSSVAPLRHRGTHGPGLADCAERLNNFQLFFRNFQQGLKIWNFIFFCFRIKFFEFWRFV